ncbi:MAG: riboflavin synthase [Thermodesulfobacteria bacterium]|nr:riboflavin synthase [Thermodesulfobacteriota bacterium]
MFTGIVEGLGEIVKKAPLSRGVRFEIRAPFDLSDTKLGDSIAVNGACLTVVDLRGDTFAVDVSPETLSRTTLGTLTPGEKVNLERALRLGDRLGGHLVSGHVDGIGEVTRREEKGEFIFYRVRLPQGLSRYVIEKGSIAIDGISLTVNRVYDHEIELAIIPHTAKLTTMGFRRPGDRVNIEVDLIGKYVERLLGPYQGRGIDEEFLRRTGFWED